jgi:hypothetical protein
MSEVELTLERILAIWWSFMWRTVLGSMVIGFMLGFIGGVIVGGMGHPQLGATVGALLGWLGSIPVSIWALRAALARKYGDLRLALVRES